MHNVVRVSSRCLLPSASSRHRNSTRPVVVAYRISSNHRLYAASDSWSRLFSSSSSSEAWCGYKDEDGPSGSLFGANKLPIGPDLVGATGSIHRTFGPRSNAEGLLATGGAALAAHASFDPDYDRAQDWIRHHAVGPAVLSPILVAGLTGALTEAAFPHGVITAQSMRHKRPLIVGVPVASMIQVISVKESQELSSSAENATNEQTRKHGYDVVLRTVVTRVRDDCVIAEGTHELWVPDYLQM